MAEDDDAPGGGSYCCLRQTLQTLEKSGRDIDERILVG